MLGENHPDVASSLNNLAVFYQSQGKYEEVETLYLQALELTRETLGEHHPATEQVRNNLDLLYFSGHQPLVKLTSLTTPPARPNLFGSDRSILSLGEDFDEPLTEFLDDP